MDNRATFVNRSDDLAILSTTVTANSGWVDISEYDVWSVFISGLETGATVSVEYANGVTPPAGHGTIATAPTVDANGNASFSGANLPYHWLRVGKVQGTTPTASVANLFGNRF